MFSLKHKADNCNAFGDSLSPKRNEVTELGSLLMFQQV